MIDPVAFKIAQIDIRWYGIIISVAVLVGIILSLQEAKKQGIEEDFFLDFFIYAIPLGIVGARLYYVIFQWEFYRDNPLLILATRGGGLAIHGALLTGIALLFIFSKKRGVSFWQALDILAPAVVLGQAIGRWGNFFNQEAHGGPVSYEFIRHFPEFIQRQMYIGGQYYHPAFLYESIWNLLVFLFLIYLRRRPYIKKGDVFLTYAIAYSLGRFFIEGIRTDSLMLGPLRVAQVLSLTVIVLGSIFIYIRHRRRKRLDVK